MIRTMLGALVALMAVSIAGCKTGDMGWVTDSEQYWRLSGFEVKAPSGPNWYKVQRDEGFPNGIAFENKEQIAYDFTLTGAVAFGVPINKPFEDDHMVKDGLRKLLTQYLESRGVILQETHFDSSLGASCWKYEGKPDPDKNTTTGEVRVHSVSGFLCAHPEYQDFLVGLEAVNAASVRIGPANHKHQTEHFFRSIRFTPRSLPAKPEKRSIDEGKALRG